MLGGSFLKNLESMLSLLLFSYFNKYRLPNSMNSSSAIMNFCGSQPLMTYCRCALFRKSYFLYVLSVCSPFFLQQDFIHQSFRAIWAAFKIPAFCTGHGSSRYSIKQCWSCNAVQAQRDERPSKTDLFGQPWCFQLLGREFLSIAAVYSAVMELWAGMSRLVQSTHSSYKVILSKLQKSLAAIFLLITHDHHKTWWWLQNVIWCCFSYGITGVFAMVNETLNSSKYHSVLVMGQTPVSVYATVLNRAVQYPENT